MKSKETMIDLNYVKVVKLPSEAVAKIKKLIEEQRLSMRQLSLISKDMFDDKDRQISHIFLSKLLAEETDGISIEKLESICSILGTTIEHILPNSLVRLP